MAATKEPCRSPLFSDRRGQSCHKQVGEASAYFLRSSAAIPNIRAFNIEAPNHRGGPIWARFAAGIASSIPAAVRGDGTARKPGRTSPLYAAASQMKIIVHDEFAPGPGERSLIWWRMSSRKKPSVSSREVGRSRGRRRWTG